MVTLIEWTMYLTAAGVLSRVFYDVYRRQNDDEVVDGRPATVNGNDRPPSPASPALETGEDVVGREDNARTTPTPTQEQQQHLRQEGGDEDNAFQTDVVVVPGYQVPWAQLLEVGRVFSLLCQIAYHSVLIVLTLLWRMVPSATCTTLEWCRDINNRLKRYAESLKSRKD